MENKAIWKEFLFTDIFEIKDGYYNKKPPFDGGKIPFLGASLFNNAVTGFVSENIINTYDKVGNKSTKDINKRIFRGKCIAIVNNGTAVGKAYYQEHPFTCSHDVTPVYLKDHPLSSEIAMFLIPLIEKSGEPFKYANKWRPKRIKRSKIMLPVDENGHPDWGFMESYSVSKITQVSDRWESLNSNPISDHRDLGDLDWKEFYLNQVFDTIKRGKRLTKANQKTGLIPYVSSSMVGNGVDNFISNNKGVRKFKNALTLANSGSVGSTFFQPFEFVASDHVTALKNKQFNKYHYLFLSACIEKLADKYSFNREINDTRIKREKIMLPVNDIGEPDYEFMEQYMKRIENKIIERTAKKEADQ